MSVGPMGGSSPMEGIEIQLRTQTRIGTVFPLSVDREVIEGDHFRGAKEKLQRALQSIEQYYATPEAGPHQPPGCTRCLARKQEINDAYHEYYLSTDSEVWYHEFPQYQQDMSRLFDELKDIRDSLDHLQLIYQSALRLHLKQNLCTANSSDTKEISQIKNETSKLFDENLSIADIANFYVSSVRRLFPTSQVQSFLNALQNSRTAEERAHLYSGFYCNTSWNDPSEQKNFKAKYARMFEQLVPHDEVLAVMKRDADETHVNKIADKKSKLSDLQMAQSAHLKVKARRVEKDQRIHENLVTPTTPVIADCSFDGCPVELDLMEENYECAICEWLVSKDPASHKRRAYYCSVEHAEEDADRHEHVHHKCSMGDRCLNYPDPGPPGDTDAGGICQQCAKEFAEEDRHGQTPFFYFCSDECYRHNLDTHRSDMHLDHDRPGPYEVLERFRPAQDMQLAT